MRFGSVPTTPRFASYHPGHAAAISAGEASGSRCSEAIRQSESPARTTTVDRAVPTAAPGAGAERTEDVPADVVGDPGAVGLAVAVAGCQPGFHSVSYTHLRAHETRHDLVCR